MEVNENLVTTKKPFTFTFFLRAITIYIKFVFVSVERCQGCRRLTASGAYLLGDTQHKNYCALFFIWVIFIFTLLYFCFATHIWCSVLVLPWGLDLGGGDCSDRPDQNESWSGRLGCLWYILRRRHLSCFARTK